MRGSHRHGDGAVKPGRLVAHCDISSEKMRRQFDVMWASMCLATHDHLRMPDLVPVNTDRRNRRNRRNLTDS